MVPLSVSRILQNLLKKKKKKRETPPPTKQPSTLAELTKSRPGIAEPTGPTMNHEQLDYRINPIPLMELAKHALSEQTVASANLQAIAARTSQSQAECHRWAGRNRLTGHQVRRHNDAAFLGKVKFEL